MKILKKSEIIIIFFFSFEMLPQISQPVIQLFPVAPADISRSGPVFTKHLKAKSSS